MPFEGVAVLHEQNVCHLEIPGEDHECWYNLAIVGSVPEHDNGNARSQLSLAHVDVIRSSGRDSSELCLHSSSRRRPRLTSAAHDVYLTGVVRQVTVLGGRVHALEGDAH